MAAKLFFWYGAMWAGKSMEIIKVAYNYRERGMEVLMFNYIWDTRFWAWKIASRSWIALESISFSEDTGFYAIIKNHIEKQSLSCILVDEAQFLKVSQVEELSRVVIDFDIPVMCYGLKTNFQTHLFEWSKRLLELANNIEELKTVCWCGSKAIINARISNGQVIRTGEELQIGWNESYISLCLRHHLSGQILK
jgi:thymidine kinase